MVEDNSPLESYKLDPHEVPAICICPIDELIRMHTEDGYTFETPAIRSNGTHYSIRVTKDLIPYNWDNYHFKMALLADRFVKGEKNLLC